MISTSQRRGTNLTTAPQFAFESAYRPSGLTLEEAHSTPPLPPVSYQPRLTLEAFAGTARPIIHPPLVPALAPAHPSGTNTPQTIHANASHSRPAHGKLRCPKCNGLHVRLSRPRTRFERFLNLLGPGVHRCHSCFYRYISLFGREIVRNSR